MQWELILLKILRIQSWTYRADVSIFIAKAGSAHYKTEP